MSALRPAFFILYLESFISRLNVILCHDLTLSVSEPDNAAAQTGVGTSFGANGDHHYTSSGTLYLFLRLNHSETITRKRVLSAAVEGKNRPVATNFQFLKISCSIRDFTSSIRLASFLSDLVGVALVGATPLHLLSQTALPLKSPTGAFIAPLRCANAVPPQTLLMVRT